AALQHTTHILENLLDFARRGELTLRREHVDLFLETKDVLHEQLEAYRQGGEPDEADRERICTALQRVTREEIGAHANVDAAPASSGPPPAAAAAAAGPASGLRHYRVGLVGVAEKDRELLIEELGHLGKVVS